MVNADAVSRRTIALDLGDETRPFLSKAPASRGVFIAHKKDAGARFSAGEIPSWPMLVRNDVRGWDAELVCEKGGESRGPIQRGGLASGAAELADFDSDARAITDAAIIGMIPLLRWQKVLGNFAIVDGV